MFFIVWTAVAPSRSYAFVAPPGVIPPPAFVAASTSPSPLAVGVGALAVGAVVGYLVVGAVFGDDSTDAARIQLAARSDAPPNGPALPSTQAQGATVTMYIGGGKNWSSWQAACDAAMAYQYRNGFPTNYYVKNTTSGGVCQRREIYIPTGVESGDLTLTVGTTTSPCPQGYVVSGGSCALDSARIGASDKKQDVLMSGTGSSRAFSVPQDVDTPPLNDGSKLSPILRGDGTNTKTAYVYGKDSSGRQVLIEVAISADGSQTYVRHYTQDDTTGQSQVISKTATIDASTGVVTSVSSDVKVGSVAVPSTGTVSPSSTASPSTTTTPTVTTTTVVPQQMTINLPTDYARTGEAATAASTVVAKLESGIKIDDSSFVGLFSPTLPDSQTENINKAKTVAEELCTGPACAADSPLNPGISWLPSLMPGEYTACHPITFHGVWGDMDASYDLDLCPYLDIARAVIGWLLNVAAVIYIWRRFTNMHNGG